MMKKFYILPAILLTFTFLCACSESNQQNRVLYDMPLFSSPDDYKLNRTLKFDVGHIFKAEGSVIGISEVKNIARLYFSDSQRAFSEIDFFSDGKKCKLIKRVVAEDTFAKFQLEYGGSLELKKNDDGFLEIKADFESAKSASMTAMLPNEFFVSTITEVDGARFAIQKIDGNPAKKIFRNFKKISFRTDTKENSFAILSDGNADAEICFGRNFAMLKISAASTTLALKFDMGFAKTFAPQPPPDGSSVKVRDVDFWLEERMVLPDISAKNLLQNSSFEMGFQYLTFRYFMSPAQNAELWKSKPVKISDTVAKFGRRSLSIASDSPKKYLDQKISTASIALEKGVYTFSTWAKTDASKQSLCVSFAPADKVYQKNMWPTKTFSLGKDWRRYSFSFEVTEAQISPIVFAAMSDSYAVCHIDGMQLERGVNATKYEPASVEIALETNFPNNIIKFGEKIGAKLSVASTPNARGKIEAEIFDFFGEKIFSKTIDFLCDTDGFTSLPLDIENISRGVFLLKTRAGIDGGKTRYNIQRFTVADFLENVHKNKNLFVDTYVDPLSTQQNFPDVLAWYKKMGYGARAGYANRDTLIADTAALYGVDSLITYVGRIQKDKKLGRKLIFLENVNWFSFPEMSYKKALLLDDRLNLPARDVTSDYLKKVEDVSAYITQKYTGVKVWSNVCEPEGSMTYFANPDFAKYEDFLKFVEIECAVARGVRKGNPSAKLSTSVTSTLARADRLHFFDKLLEETSKRGVRYDCAGAHIYRSAPEYPRPTLEDNYLELFKIFKKHGYGDIDVYSPEGLHWLPIHCFDVSFVPDLERRKNPLRGVLPYTYDIGHGERLATALRARTWLLGLKYGRIKCMNASNYGVTQMDAAFSPYAYHKVPNTLGCLLGDATFCEELRLFPDTRCYIFDDGKGRMVAALWACKSEFDRGTQSPPKMFFTPVESMKIFDLMQAEKSVAADVDGLFKLPLSIYPVFVSVEKSDIDNLRCALKSAKWKSQIPVCPTAKFRIASFGKIAVEIENPYSENMEGKISMRGDAFDVSIPAESSQKFVFDNYTPIKFDEIKTVSEKILLREKSPDKTEITFVKSLRIFGVKNAKSQMNTDGDLSDWRDVPSIKLTNMRRSAKLWRKGIMPSSQQFSAEYKMVRDGQKLRVVIAVRDDKFVTARDASREAAVKSDCVEILIDTFADAADAERGSSLDSNDWHYLITKAKDSDNAVIYRQSVPDAQLTLGILGAKAHTLADDVKGVFKKTQDGYIVELEFLPTSILPFKLAPNTAVGFCVIVNDFDDPATPQPDARLTNSSARDGLEKKPSKFPQAVFE